MDWINVADTAIKIGLGAVVAGTFGYVLAKRNAKTEAEKVYTDKRRELLSKVVDILNAFHKTYTNFRARYHDHILRRDAKQVDTKAELDELAKYELSFTYSFDQLIDAQGYILSIGEIELYDALGSYTKILIDALEKFEIGNLTIAESDITQINANVLKARENTFLKLSVAYKRIASP